MPGEAEPMQRTPRRFEGRGAIVTGGGNGIGAAIVRRLAQEGCRRVYALDISDSPELREGLPDDLQSVITLHCVDVSQEEEIKSFFDSFRKEEGALDVLVNNAARFVFAAAQDVTGEQLDQAFSVNVRGAALMTKHAVPLLKRQRQAEHGAITGGAVVNVSSISSSIAQPGFVPYSVSKGALAQLTRNQAVDLAPLGIRVNAVNPGPILTQGTARQAASEGRSLEEMCAQLSSGIVLGRMGRPAEVAAAAAFLASDDASFVTGAALVVDGGYTLQ